MTNLKNFQNCIIKKIKIPVIEIVANPNFLVYNILYNTLSFYNSLWPCCIHKPCIHIIQHRKEVNYENK